MPFTTLGWLQSIDPAGAYTALTFAGGDQHISQTGTTVIKVPELSQIVAAAAGVDITVESFARLVSPSLRAMSRFEIEPFSTATAAAVKPTSPQPVIDLRAAPLVLPRDEGMTFEIRSDPVAAQYQWGMLWMADGPVPPVTGRIFTVRATGATVLVAGSWTNVPLTLNEDLPRGRYQVVGARFRSTGCVAGRFVPVGGRWRPGALGVTAQGDVHHPMFRFGQLGVWFEFEDTDVPSADFLSVSADAAQRLDIDLIQIRSGAA